MSVKIKCPKCGRILGDTASSFDAILNCPNCKQVHAKIIFADNTPYAKLNKERNTND